ncbi:MAG: hypothetical protein ACK5T6_18885, partial [Pirellula sp.]
YKWLLDSPQLKGKFLCPEGIFTSSLSELIAGAILCLPDYSLLCQRSVGLTWGRSVLETIGKSI